MKLAKTLMIQGTASHVGKTMIVAALCRIFSEMGLKVAPFKAQNMSLNSYVTLDGGEIAWAQALQALASGIEPETYMNPILLKPTSNGKIQVVINGRAVADVHFRDYLTGPLRPRVLKTIKESLKRLMSIYDLIIMEGAGSPAEINLYDVDLTNMYVASLANSPVIIVGDIDRGGVFASLYGTLKLLKPKHRALVKGFIINKFRGEKSILKAGIERLEALTGKRVLGIIPFLDGFTIAPEDSLSLEERDTYGSGPLKISVIRLPHISNFTDLDPLISQPLMKIRYVRDRQSLDGSDAIIIPGTKNTIRDLEWLNSTGIGDAIVSLSGKIPIIGICGGFQMLGNKVIDERGIEDGRPGTWEGLSLLDVMTYFSEYLKKTVRVEAEVICGHGLLTWARGGILRGYEVHMGNSKVSYFAKRAFRIISTSGRPDNRLEGVISNEGTILGTYIHGLFREKPVRDSLMRFLKERAKDVYSESLAHSHSGDIYLHMIGKFAEIVYQNVDINYIKRIIKL